MKPSRRHTLLGLLALPFARFLGIEPHEGGPRSIVDLLERAVVAHEEQFGRFPDVILVSVQQLSDYMAALGISPDRGLWFSEYRYRGVLLLGRPGENWPHPPWAANWTRPGNRTYAAWQLSTLTGVPIPPRGGRRTVIPWLLDRTLP